MGILNVVHTICSKDQLITVRITWIRIHRDNCSVKCGDNRRAERRRDIYTVMQPATVSGIAKSPTALPSTGISRIQRAATRNRPTLLRRVILQYPARRVLPRARAADLVHRHRRDPARPRRFMRYYNLERSHRGYRLKGRTPAQALMEALGVDVLPEIIPTEEVIEPLPTAA